MPSEKSGLLLLKLRSSLVLIMPGISLNHKLQPVEMSRYLSQGEGVVIYSVNPALPITKSKNLISLLRVPQYFPF